MRSCLLCLGIVVMLLAASTPVAAGVKAWLDSQECAPGESVRLTLEHDGQDGTLPDLTPLQKEFDILGSSQSSRLRISNGRMSSDIQLQVTLSPRHAGKLVIPPLTWGADSTAPLTLAVSDGSGGQGAAAGPSKVLLETEVDTARPYVLSAVRLTVRVYGAVPLYRESLEMPAGDAVAMRPLGMEESSRAERNGVPYLVRTRHYLLFPQKSGTLSLPGPTLNALIETSAPRSDPYDPFALFGGMVRGVRPIRLHGEPITLTVQPRPASVSAPYWLPARNVSLEASWQPQSLQARAGEPISVQLTLHALGLTAAQLPDLGTLLSIPAQLRTYAEQPKLSDEDQPEGVQGSREQTLAVIADQPGQYSIPALHIAWWDTQADQPREVSVPARTLVILPAVAAAVAGAAPARVPAAAAAPLPAAGAAPAPGAGPWPLVSAALLALWLATAGAWAWSRRHPAAAGPAAAPSEPASAARARAAFHEACRRHDAPGARRHLLAWAQQVEGTDAPAGLGALARGLDPALTPLLQGLDRACFAGDAGHWDGEPLSRALTALPVASKAAARAAGLAPLYP
jgi:hypothetical protein